MFNRINGMAVVFLTLTSGVSFGDEADVVFADFERTDYGRWIATGTAFGAGPAKGTLPNQMPVSGFKGKGLVKTLPRLPQFEQVMIVGMEGPQQTVRRTLTSFKTFRLRRRKLFSQKADACTALPQEQ